MQFQYLFKSTIGEKTTFSMNFSILNYVIIQCVEWLSLLTADWITVQFVHYQKDMYWFLTYTGSRVKDSKSYRIIKDKVQQVGYLCLSLSFFLLLHFSKEENIFLGWSSSKVPSVPDKGCRLKMFCEAENNSGHWYGKKWEFSVLSSCAIPKRARKEPGGGNWYLLKKSWYPSKGHLGFPVGCL